ncbi:hypothetical protein NLJ89_g3424 [Agrocybe chaxingu]|uniref:Uncharacterized protein n=1 Tax=Agrocybe chaxingu TaxID=84603 RepID=A0A9W8K423_9AGAR|nr:hypothetical protein NLJ89_g3424 [Agrocybe chaxingu]
MMTIQGPLTAGPHERLELDKAEYGHLYFKMKSGVYFRDTVGLWCLTLPKSHEEQGQWREIQLEKRLLAYGIAIEESDLLAVVTRDSSNYPHLAIQLRLLEHSTHEVHPDALTPIIEVCTHDTDENGKPLADVVISGTNLAVFIGGMVNWEGYIYIWDWKTGVRKAVLHNVDLKTGMAFVREDFLLIGDPFAGSLDVYHVPSPSDTAQQEHEETQTRFILTLGLPYVDHAEGLYRYSISFISDGQIPLSASGKTGTNQPFMTKPANSVVLVNIHVRNYHSNKFQQFTLVVKWDKLIALAERGHAEYIAYKTEEALSWSNWAADGVVVIRHHNGYRRMSYSGGTCCFLWWGQNAFELLDFNIPLTGKERTKRELPDYIAEGNRFGYKAIAGTATLYEMLYLDPDIDSPFLDSIRTPIPPFSGCSKSIEMKGGEFIDDIFMDGTRIVGLVRSRLQPEWMGIRVFSFI